MRRPACPGLVRGLGRHRTDWIKSVRRAQSASGRVVAGPVLVEVAGIDRETGWRVDLVGAGTVAGETVLAGDHAAVGGRTSPQVNVGSAAGGAVVFEDEVALDLGHVDLRAGRELPV